MTEAVGQCKFEHGPRLARGQDFGHAWSYRQLLKAVIICLITKPTFGLVLI